LKYITRTVWILSLVSLFTDTASEMLYPVMPIYLKYIGFSIVLIGVLEGFAEAIAGISKGYFGKLSDLSKRRVPFVQLGYTFSAISKPMMAVFIFPIWIFFARTIDRFGKGLRTGARDAMLSEEASAKTKAKVFGFHKSMDTFGAVLGPSFALLYLYYNPENYKTLFFIAFIPGVLAVASTFFLKDKHRESRVEVAKTSFFSFLGYWKHSSLEYKRLLLGLLVFTFFNSSDIFLLLKAKDAGLEDYQVIGVYIFYNLIYALSAFPSGILADKIGFKKMFVFGLLLFSIVYFGMGLTEDFTIIIALFFIYGIYAAATEGVSKAWISNIVNKDHTATAIGMYSGFQSIFAMLASSMAGILWYTFGSSTTFLITAIGTLLISAYFLIVVKSPVYIENKSS